eukprot:gene4092-4379_t
MGSGSSLNTLNSSESCLSISVNVFANLSDDLLQELLLYLSPFEIMEFSRANNDLKNRLKKCKSRLYFLRLGDGSPSTLDLNFYYYQRKLGPFFTPFPFAKFEIVQCSTGHLPLLVRNKADLIQDLQITFDKPVNYELKKDLEPLAEALEASKLVVNKLTLWRTERFALPVFHGVVSLTIHERSHQNNQHINVYNLVNVKKLLLSNHPFLIDERPLPSSLSSLSIFSCPVLSRLPENNLRSVRISSCEKFLSLENMTNIKNVELTGLNIESLDGLGVANRSIMISNCRKIRDWNAMRENDFVSVKNNPFPISLYCRRLGAERYREPVRDIPDSTDMEVITHFSMTLRFPMNFTNAKKLRELIVDVPRTHRDECWRLLEAVMPLPRVEKIVLKPWNIVSEIQSDRRLPMLLSTYGFAVHYSNKSLVLLRKENDRTNNRWKIPAEEILSLFCVKQMYST